ncbi:MAG: hypothetical protein LBL45_10200 [Treponema sp.]|jgi:hypothetical protein|nr:hypothetical protein [Treponema sp.]
MDAGKRSLRNLSIEKQAAARIRALMLRAAFAALKTGRVPIEKLYDDLYDLISKYSEAPARELREEILGRKNADADDPSKDFNEKKWLEFGRKLAMDISLGAVTKRMIEAFFKRRSLPPFWADQYYDWAKKLDPKKIALIPEASWRVVSDAMAWGAGGKRVAYQAVFTHRHTLSKAIWGAAEDAQKKIMAVVDGGRALGRDGVDIARDLEELCQHSDGARRVKGRWGRLAPDKKLEDRTNRIMQDRGWDSWDIEKMKEARKEAIKELHKEGWALSQNPNAEEYYKRLGTAGADYRALRVERTETQFMLRDEAQRDAGLVGMGVKWTLTHSHHSGCACAGNPNGTLFKGNNYSKGVVNGRQVGTRDGVFRPQDLPDIPHPNCMCLMQSVEMPAALSFQPVETPEALSFPS